MKTVSPERWKQIEDLLDGALDCPPDERSRFLDERCADDPALRQAVASLVLACEAPTRLPPTPDLAGPILAHLASEPDRAVGPARIGPYRVIRELGQGGMGTVLLAERDDDQFHKLVAIKVLRRGLAGEDMVRRFRRERQILASLDHPGIARLLDGGIGPDGAPYIVMEHVEGVPLDAYARREPSPTLTERIELFMAVAEAVEHAHQQLIVHRDLKPSNILVTADGRPKLLDFGIAKLVDDDEATDAPLTRTGVRVMTPEYASPEQVRGHRITPSSDVYSLGVILYELLVGHRPYVLTGKSLGEIDRIVSETEPPRPSAATGAVKTSFRRQLRGDLDTITMRALHKDPARRYPSAAALRDDLRRYREGRPVLARPDTLLYRSGKFLRRHAGAVSVFLMIVAGVLATADRQRTLRGRAEAEAVKAEAAKQFLIDAFTATDPYGPTGARKGEPLTAEALLERSARRIDTALAGEPALRAEMTGVLGRVFANLGNFDRSAELLERALAERRSLPGVSAAELAESMTDLGALEIRRARYDVAESLLREAMASLRTAPGDQRRRLASAIDRLATALQQQSRHADAEPLFREVLDLRLALDSTSSEVADSYNNLGLAMWWKGDYQAADSLYRIAIDVARKAVGPEHPMVAEMVHNLAQAIDSRGQRDSAIVLYRESLAHKRRVFGDAHPSVTVHLNNLGRVLREQGQLDEAEAMFREAIELDTQVFGPDHPYVAAGLDNLGSAMLDRGRFPEGERVFRQALEIYRRASGDSSSSVGLLLNNIAVARYRAGDVAGAEPYYERAVATYRTVLGADHPYTMAVSAGYAGVLRDLGKLGEAETIWRAVLAKFEPGLPGTRPRVAQALVGLGRTLVGARRAAEAESVLAKGLEMMEAQYGADDWRTGEARLGRGSALRALGREAEARRELRRGRDLLVEVRSRQPRLAREAELAVAGLR